MVALDKEGHILGTSFTRNEIRVTSSIEDLGGIRWMRRDGYEVATVPVMFRNISLLSGRKAEIKIEVGGAEYEVGQAKISSLRKMHELGMALIQYSNDNQGFLPASLSAEEFGAYLNSSKGKSVLIWALKNVQYLGGGKDVNNLNTRPDLIPIAFDNGLLKEFNSATVLFINGAAILTDRNGLNRFGTDPDRIGRDNRRLYSAEKLKTLGSAVLMYADDHEQALPEGMTEAGFKKYLEPRDENQAYEWLIQNVHYILKEKRVQDIRNILLSPVAYDRSLLKMDEGTNVLFLDNSVKFVLKGELRKYGIDPDKE